MNLTNIGKIIEKFRKEKGLTQRQLADKLGVSNTAVSKWENGNNLPDIAMLEPISEILEVDLLSLVKAQNNSVEECSKKKCRIRRNKNIKLLITIIISIITIVAVSLITKYNTSKKYEEIIANQVEVYKISSLDEDYYIDGYLIFNDKESKIIIKSIKDQTSSPKPIQVSQFRVSLNIGNNKLFLLENKVDNTKKVTTQELLNTIVNENISKNVNFKRNVCDFSDSKIKIIIRTTKDEKTEKDIKVSLIKQFT